MNWISTTDGCECTDETGHYDINLLNNGHWRLSINGEAFRVGALDYCKGQADMYRVNAAGIYRTKLDQAVARVGLKWIANTSGLSHTDETRIYRINLLNSGQWRLSIDDGMSCPGTLLSHKERCVGTLEYCKTQALVHKTAAAAACAEFGAELENIITDVLQAEAQA